MKITNAKEQLVIDIREGRIPVLVLENPDVFSDFIGDIYLQSQGDDGDIILSEGDKILAFSKTAMMISDYFSLDFNQRKIQSVLYKNMQSAAAEFSMEKESFAAAGMELLDKLLENLRFNHITYNFDLDWNDIFKLFQVKIEEDYVSLIEKIISFMRICCELLNLKLLIFVGLKAYIPEEQLEEIYKMAEYFKLNLLLIEPIERQALQNEDYYIIDRDKCLIIK